MLQVFREYLTRELLPAGSSVDVDLCQKFVRYAIQVPTSGNFSVCSVPVTL